MIKRKTPDEGLTNPRPTKKLRDGTTVDSELAQDSTDYQSNAEDALSATEETVNDESCRTVPTGLATTAPSTANGTTRSYRYPSDQKLFACHFPGCDKKYNRPTRLTAHLRSHTNDRPYKCTFEGCDKSYREKKHLDFHIQGSHEKPAKSHACQVEGCDKSFQTATRLRRHQLVHEGKERFRCRDHPPCSESFRKHQTLQRHIRTEHLHLAAFPCKEEGCDAGFPSAAMLRRHAQREHGEIKFWCDECGASDEKGEEGAKVGFTTLELLQAHLRSEHLNCMFCDAKAKGSWELNQHIELYHSGISVEERKTVACPWDACEKKFTKKSNLQVHIRTVHEGHRFVCGQVDVSATEGLHAWSQSDGCGNGFGTKASLEHHIRFVHLGHERPKMNKPAAKRSGIVDELSGAADKAKRNIPCPINDCVYKFIRHHDLQVHLEFHHNEPKQPIHEGDAQVLGLAQPDVPDVFSSTFPDDHVYEEPPLPAEEEEELWIGARQDYGFLPSDDEWAQDEREMRALIEDFAYPLDPALQSMAE